MQRESQNLNQLQELAPQMADYLRSVCVPAWPANHHLSRHPVLLQPPLQPDHRQDDHTGRRRDKQQLHWPVNCHRAKHLAAGAKLGRLASKNIINRIRIHELNG